MALGPGEWGRAGPHRAGASRGQRGEVTSTGFLGGLDFELENGERVRGVDRGAVVPGGPSGPVGSSSGTGGRMLGTALAVLAVLVITAVLVWLRWGR